MTRIMLLILSIVEITLGAFGVVAVTLLALSHPAGMTAISLSMVAITALLLAAGAAIFIRRPWSYYLHIAVILLVGLLAWLNPAALVGSEMVFTLPLGAVVVALTATFFLPAVRRYFGL